MRSRHWSSTFTDFTHKGKRLAFDSPTSNAMPAPFASEACLTFEMTKIVAASGQCSLARDGKQHVGVSMYAKGKAFVGAAMLVGRRGSSEQMDHVALQLLCQGFEVTLKGLLLLRDYDRFIGRIRKPIGHDLVILATETSAAFGMRPMRPVLMNELRTLSQLYSKHLLRYGSGYDILVDPRTIPRERVFRRLAAVIRLAERELRTN
jgi:hypothetical protein